jgi:hypothetical protein
LKSGNSFCMPSRLAKKPIPVPAKVEVTAADGMLTVKGSKATLSRSVHSSISMNVTPEGVVITPNNNSRLANALTGTFAAHLNAMMQGVETPFKKVLILNGVGETGIFLRKESVVGCWLPVLGCWLLVSHGLAIPIFRTGPAG